MRTLEQQQGFSLIELLIVVVITGIIAAIAIPYLIASRRAANEGAAQSSMRTIHSCQITYQATVGLGDYGDLTTLAAHTLTDSVLGSGNKSGYSFVASPTTAGLRPALFYATAVPSVISGPGQTGARRFGITEDGIMRGDAIALTPYADDDAVRAAPALGN